MTKPKHIVILFLKYGLEVYPFKKKVDPKFLLVDLVASVKRAIMDQLYFPP